MCHCDWSSHPGSTSSGKQSMLSLPDHYTFGRLKLAFQCLTATNLRKGHRDGFPSVPWHHMGTAPAYRIPIFIPAQKINILSQYAWWSMNTISVVYHDRNVAIHACIHADSWAYSMCVWCAKLHSPSFHTILHWQSESGTMQKVLSYCWTMSDGHPHTHDNRHWHLQHKRLLLHGPLGGNWVLFQQLCRLGPHSVKMKLSHNIVPLLYLFFLNNSCKQLCFIYNQNLRVTA